MSMDSLHPHSGHRQRMRSRFYATGAEGFQPHEILELLLYAAIPKRDVNPLAHRLMDHFSTIDGVLNASREELMEVPGIGPHTCDFLQIISQAVDYYEHHRFSDRYPVSGLHDAVSLVQPLFHTSAEREMALLFEDGTGALLHMDCFSWNMGSEDRSRDILRQALLINAQRVVLILRRPGAARRPGKAELQEYAQLISLLSQVDIYTVDFLIVSDAKMLSLRQDGLLHDESRSFRDTDSASSHWLDSVLSLPHPDGWYLVEDLLKI